jgi:hypothetical protein
MTGLKKIVAKIAKEKLLKEIAGNAQPPLVNDLLEPKKPSKKKITIVLGVIAAIATGGAQYFGG